MEEDEENIQEEVRSESPAMEWVVIVLIIALFLSFFLMIVVF